MSERLRRLDDAAFGPPPPASQQAPAWVRAATGAMGTWFLLLVYVVEYRTLRWLVAAIAYGAVEVPAFVAAARWYRRRGTLPTRARLLVFAAFPLVLGVGIVVAAALAPAPWARSRPHSHYAVGCHPASAEVVARIRRTITGDFHVGRVVVYGSRDAAVATALLSGTLDVGGLKVPLDRQPADYVVAPDPLASNNDLARRASPSLQTLIAGGPIGSAWDQVNNDRVAAENCAGA